MSIKTVLRMGDPCLLESAKPIEKFDTPELHGLIQDLEDTMTSMQGAGIAAPQIGISLRLVIFGQKEDDSSKNPRYEDANEVPYTVLINPTLAPLSDEVESGWEGCLSVPNMRGIVPRYQRLHYTGFDQYGNIIDRMVSGFHARVVQHECDHLDGVLYPMRIKDLRDFGYLDVFFPEEGVPES